MALTFRALALAGALAGTTMIVAPAAAAPLPSGAALAATPLGTLDFSRYDPVSATTEWRRCRWGCGWGGHRRGWRRNRVDAGDVLIGAAIIGGIAAIVSSNNRRERERDVVIVDRDVRNPDWRDDDRRYDDRRDDRRTSASRGTGASGLDNAVNQCLDRIERDVRVDTVNDVERTASGWQVTGSIFNGAQFRCRIGNNGQIDTIDYDGTFGAGDWREPQADAGRPAAGQLDDQSYAQMRAELGGTVRPDIAVQEATMTMAQAPAARATTTTAMPAYPGGPIPGEVIPETVDSDL